MMINKLSRSIDQLLFKKIDTIKSSPIYMDIMNRLESLGDGSKKILLQTTSIVIIAIPVIAIILFISSNINVEQELSIKQDIHDAINRYKSNKRHLATIKQQVATTYVLRSKRDFIKKVQESASEQSNFKITNFDKRTVYSITKTTATLSFKDISTSELMNLVGRLTSKDKIKIASIKISKNEANDSLKGSMDLIHYGRANTK